MPRGRSCPRGGSCGTAEINGFEGSSMQKVTYDFTGSTALVTGAGTGIGFGVATELARVGATVTIMGHLEDQIAPAVEKLQKQFGADRIRAAVGDVTNEE